MTVRVSSSDNLPRVALFASDLPYSVQSTICERRDCGLHPNLDGFEGAKCNISEEFGGRTGSQVQRSFVLVSSLLSCQIGIELFEVFVSAVLECALGLKIRGQPLSACFLEDERAE